MKKIDVTVWGQSYCVFDHDDSLTVEHVLKDFENQPAPAWVSPKRIVDLGAYCGLFSFWAAKAYPDCVVLAVEPCADSAELIAEGILANRLENQVSIVEAAVTGATKEKQVCLYRQPGNFGASSKYNLPYFESTICNTVSIASVLSEPAHVKMDIEGSEFDVLPLVPWENVLGLHLELHGPGLPGFFGEPGKTLNRENAAAVRDKMQGKPLVIFGEM